MWNYRAARLLRRPWSNLLACALALLLILLTLIGADTVEAAPVTGAGAPLLARPASVSVRWRDDSALATWPAVPGADGYLVSLVRLRDGAVMARTSVPASQRIADLAGVWPGERYVVAVQTLDAANRAGRPALSEDGAATPLAPAAFAGFEDDALAVGPLDASQWDQRTLSAGGPTDAAADVTGAGVTGLIAGCPDGSPCEGQRAVTVLRARAPFDWTGRALTVHGEVDLKGDAHQSFGVILAPQVVGPARVLDLGQGFFQPVALPLVELYTSRGTTSLLYSAGYGSFPMALARVPNPIGISGVRDDIVWRVSASHTSVQLDGVTVFDLDWPTALSFDTGYLSLFAEDDPGAGPGSQPICDEAPNACAVWHLGAWGFDAPAGAYSSANPPATAAYDTAGCGPLSTAPADASGEPPAAALCGATDVAAGAVATFAVPVASAVDLGEAGVVFEARNLALPGGLTLSINGGAPLGVPDVVADGGQSEAGAFEVYRVPIAPALLAPGVNHIAFQVPDASDGPITLANIQIEAVSRGATARTGASAEPAPLGYWSASDV